MNAIADFLSRWSARLLPVFACLVPLRAAELPKLSADFGRSIVAAANPVPASVPARSSPSLVQARPNLVVILTDDQGYGELGCHGNPILKTPHLDRFHAESTRFTDFHVSPTCSPTRTALMTGRHEFKSGVTHTIYERERMSLKATTIAQVLKGAGYATGVFGKWHLGDEAAYQPDRRGFDEVFIHGAGGIGQTYPGSCGDAPGNTYFHPVILHNGKFVKTEGYCTDVFFGQALRWIEAQRQARAPFLAYITPNAPHGPYISPGAQYEQPYLGRGLRTNAIAYYAMISNIDENVGKLILRLRAWNLETNTLVVFMTDNGHSIGDLYNAGMRSAKGSPYQGGTRVPSLWRWPGTLKAGVDVDKLTAHLDLFPTFAELAGATLQPAMAAKLDGRSLLPLLQDADAAWPDRFLFTHVGRWARGAATASKHEACAVRNSRFRLVNDRELYDIKSDPGETRNVIEQYPVVVAALRAAYNRWWEDVLPCLENEYAIGPKVNPFKALYWQQLGGGPDQALLKVMNPEQAMRQSGRSPAAHVTTLGVRGTQFTINGQPTFLYGMSYYGALGAKEEFLHRDLDEIQRLGFNWIRVWANWSAFSNDVAAVGADGAPREPLLSKLRFLLTECDRRGLIVDVTLSRGNGVTGPARLQSHADHRRAVETLVTALQPWRNWYLDLSNERNIRDSRHTGFDDLIALRAAARRLDPQRLLTASHAGDMSREECRRYVREVEVDFLAPHRPRHAESPGQTAAKTRALLAWAAELGRALPVHHQEPFRRDFGAWTPQAEDFTVDLRGAREGGAAGWCFHNGDTRSRRDGRPRRSFDLSEQRLFEQLDAEERRFVEMKLGGAAAAH